MMIVNYINILAIMILSSCNFKKNVKQDVSSNNTELIQDDTPIFRFEKLPKEKKIDEKIINEFSIKYQEELSNGCIESKLKFVNYTYDTTINETPIYFILHCIGGENEQAIHQRFLNEINYIANDIYKTAIEEKHGSLYLFVSDSLNMVSDKVNYIRYREYLLGGQTLSESEYFTMEISNIVEILNSSEYSKIDSFELLRFRKDKKYW